jgi:predicted esterase
MEKMLGYSYFFQPPKQAGGTIFVTLHAVGGTEHDLVHAVEMIDENAGILSPLGKIEEDGKHRFFNHERDGLLDEEEIKPIAKELVQFMNKVSDEKNFSREQLIWMGHSNGANLISSIMLLYPEVIRKAALLRPRITLVPTNLPSFADVYVLLAVGKQDEVVTQESNEKLIRLFQQCGAVVELFQNEATHELNEEDFAVVQRWYQKNRKN